MPDWQIRPTRANPEARQDIEIQTDGDFTLTEATAFALAILRTVQDYGKITATPKNEEF